MSVFDYIEKELDRIEIGYTSYDGTKITLTMDEVRELIQNLRKKYQPDGDVIYRSDAIGAICAICGNDCDKSEFLYNAPQDEQIILCPEHYALTQLPSAQPDVPDINVGDLISRAAAIETQEKIIADHPLDGYEDGLLLINALNDLPSMHPDQQTIACQKSDLIHRETARRIIDSPRSKSQMLTVLRCTPPAQPDNQVNLCDSCEYSYPDCPSEADDVIFGNGKGNDNICACNKYLPSAQPDYTHMVVGNSKNGITMWYECAKCTEPVTIGDKYCRNCGRKFRNG